jgi:hypothetical protein
MEEPSPWIGYWPLTVKVLTIFDSFKISPRATGCLTICYAVPDDGSSDGTVPDDDSTPIVIVVPGLTSDSTAAVSPGSSSTELVGLNKI